MKDRSHRKYGKLEKQQKHIKTNVNKMIEVTPNICYNAKCKWSDCFQKSLGLAKKSTKFTIYVRPEEFYR